MPLQEQQLLLKGAHDTVIATMDHLAVSNLLNGNQEKAAKVRAMIVFDGMEYTCLLPSARWEKRRKEAQPTVISFPVIADVWKDISPAGRRIRS